MRWSRYVLTAGNDAFSELWSDLARDPVLVVAGGGFDPRVPRAIERLVSVAQARVDLVLLDVDGGEGAEQSMHELATANCAAVTAIVTEAGGSVFEQPFPEVHAHRSAGLNISREFHSRRYLESYTQVLVDISGLPRSVFFPLISGLLHESDGPWRGNLHVVTCDSYEVDAAIVEEGAESPSALGGFSGPQSDGAWAATVWVPVLGEAIGEQLGSLLDAIGPDEVIPVLPFPSTNPRRGDDLVLEHRELLINGLAVESRNYLYAAESNPFDLYRAITELRERYQISLRPLGAANFVLSTHSSKLLSVGVLLAAFEMGLQVMHVSPSRYGLRSGFDPTHFAEIGEVTDLWLTGEPYR